MITYAPTATTAPYRRGGATRHDRKYSFVIDGDLMNPADFNESADLNPGNLSDDAYKVAQRAADILRCEIQIVKHNATEDREWRLVWPAPTGPWYRA